MKKLILLSLCWASILPAMEPKKEPSTSEQAIELLEHSKSQKPGYFDDQPNEILGHIVQYLIGNVAHAKTETELQEAMQAVTRLQRSSHRFDTLLQGEKYQKELKASLQTALNSLSIPLDLVQAVNAKRPLFIINALIKAGADINKQASNRFTALTRAAQHGYTDTVNALIKAGADINKQDNGITALILAAQNGYIDTVNALIRAGADINKQVNGFTALIWAAFHGHTDIVNALIKAGADIYLKNYEGKTALDIAKEKGNTKIITLLKDAQARLPQSSRN